MNGFAEHGLSEESFGEAKGGLASFDAFRKFAIPFLMVGLMVCNPVVHS